MKSSTKLSLIAAAVASALGSAAYALPPTSTVDATVFGAGGSAQTNAAFFAATKFLDPTTIDSYTDAAACGDSGSYRVLFGRSTKAIGTIASGKNILYFYKFNGGSFPNGIQPQIGTGATLPYPAVTGTTTVLSSATACTGAYPLPTFKFPSSIETSQTIPDWGISDAEVTLFNNTNNLNGVAALTTSQLNAISQTGVYDNLYGVAVTNNLFAHKTNFSKPEVAGILAGTITDWSQLFDDTGTPLTAGPVILLDRGSGSGSKAAGSQYFLGNPGVGTSALLPQSISNAASNATSPVGTGVNLGYTSTVLVPGSTRYQDVREASSGAIVSDLQLAQADGLRAVAILGLEFPPAGNQVAGANVYSFAKIGNVGPDTGTTGDNINGPHGGTSATKYTNVVTGAYDFFFQNSFNLRTANISGNHAAFAAEVLSDLQLSAISGANASKAFPLGVPGLLLDPVTVGGQPAGSTLGSRLGISTAPLQQVQDGVATGGAAITFGSDPL